jgi:predicted dehydrogenase
MRLKVGVCGTGAFADCFIPLFKAHPLTRELILCDLDAAKLKQKADKFGVKNTCPSLDELCQSDVDAIAIITQHHIHGPQAVQALREALRARKCTADQLWQYGKTCRVAGVMRPYMEAFFER